MNSVDMFNQGSQLFGAELAGVASVLQLGGVHGIRLDGDVGLK